MSPTRTSSRLARHEQQKLLRQTIFMAAAAIILGVGFILVVLPNFIRFITGISNPDQVLVENNQLPPQVPVLSPPVPATSSAQIKVMGFAQSETEVVLVVNSNQQDRQAVSDEGSFEFDVELSEGENQIAAFAIAKDKQESAISSSYTVVKDVQPPKLEIKEPQDGQSVELRRNQNLTISGTTDLKTQLNVNGRLIYAKNDGSFNTTYSLQEGENKLEFLAVDQAGNQTQKTIMVTFRF